MKKHTTIHLCPDGLGTVEIDGIDVSASVLAVTIEADPNNRRLTIARLTLAGVEVQAETDEVAAVLRDLRLDAASEEADRD